MEDKTLELMVGIVSVSPRRPGVSVSVLYWGGGGRNGEEGEGGSAEARCDGRNRLRRLVGRGGGGERRGGDQKSEGGPEIIDTYR